MSFVPRRHRDLLPNGLPVLTLELPHLHGVMVAAYVRAGSRHETAELNGVSHFLEHIFFRGCRKWPDAGALNGAVERMGGSLNGVTTRDHGFYYTLVHPDGLGLALDVLGAMLHAPLVKELELEREVILDEILDEVDETGRLIDVDTLSKQLIFPDHPLGLPIAGTRETVGRITEEDLRRHHGRFYVGANMALVVAGPVARQAVVEAAAAAFGGFPGGERSRDLAPPPYPDGPVVHRVDHRESQTSLALNFPAPSEDHPDYPVLAVLRRVLDDGLASRLQRGIVEKRGLAYAVSAGVEVFTDAGLFVVDASTAHAKVPELVEALVEVLGGLTRRPPEADEVERAKARYRYSAEFMQDAVGDLAAWFAEGELLHGGGVPPEIRVAQVQAVTAEDVRRVARDVFRRDAMVSVLVGQPPMRPTRRILEKAALPA